MGYRDVMGTSAPSADSGNELHRLVEQQAALRRVATLVASGASSTEVFDAVAREVGQVLRLPNTAVCRYEDEGTAMTVLAAFGDGPEVFSPGSRWPLDGPSMSAEVLRTGSPVRFEEYRDLPGSLAAAAREHGLDRVAGAPIIVDGRVWGVISTSSPDAPLPDNVEDDLGEFTELVATAIANSQAHEELTRLAEEQAALRRVATLVAAGAPPAEVFEAVSAEVAALLGADGSAVSRYEADGTVTAVSGWTTEGGYIYAGRRYELEGTVSGLIFETGRPGRVENYTEAPGEAPGAARAMGWRSSVGAPITVEGHLWGVLAVVSKSEQPLPGDTEQRLAEFAELFATSIANSEAHEQLAQLADEQAALRRVATLVAEGATPQRVFDAVRHEVARMFNAPLSGLLRYDGKGTVTQLAASEGYRGPIERSWSVEGDESAVARVCRTGLPARSDYTRPAQGSIAAAARDECTRSAVGVPVVVDGAFWGVMAVGTREAEPLPADLEGRLAKFTELLATAIANAEGRAELDASRARIVATADATRRRIERDLHDGAQQQLVSLALEVRAAQASVPEEMNQHRDELSHIAEGLTTALDGLRETALGLHPAILAEGGLGPALKTLAHRSPIPVELEVRTVGRLPESLEVAAYYVVSETLTNAAKHSRASRVQVEVDLRDRALCIAVADDGVGGADATRGSGLLGLRDRVEANGGTISIESREGAGTSLTAVLPLASSTN